MVIAMSSSVKLLLDPLLFVVVTSASFETVIGGAIASLFVATMSFVLFALMRSSGVMFLLAVFDSFFETTINFGFVRLVTVIHETSSVPKFRCNSAADTKNTANSEDMIIVRLSICLKRQLLMTSSISSLRIRHHFYRVRVST